jgi:hypothetical protein
MIAVVLAKSFTDRLRRVTDIELVGSCREQDVGEKDVHELKVG